MATIEIHLKNPMHFTVIDTEDILAVRSKNFAHVILDSPEATIRIRLSREEALTLGNKLIMHQNAIRGQGE